MLLVWYPQCGLHYNEYMHLKKPLELQIFNRTNMWLISLLLFLGLASNMAHAEEAESFADESYRKMSRSLQSTADWLDNVFLTERDDDEHAWTRLIFRLDHEIIESEGVSTDFALRGKIVLPNLNRKIRLVFEGEPDSDDVTGLKSGNDTTSAIRVLLNEGIRNRLNFDIGGRGGLNDPRLFTRLQYRYQQDYGDINLRYRPTLTWDTDDEWEGYLQFDFEQNFLDTYFFRATTIPRYNSRVDGWELEQNFKLFKEFINDQYVAVEWNNDFKSEPNFEVRASYLRLRYRREIWKQRLYFELGPGIRFVDDNDLRPQVDAYLRFELLLSSEKSNQHRRALQKNDSAATTRGNL